MTTQPLKDDTDSAATGAEWPELDELVEQVKTKRAEEQARQEAQRLAAQKATQDAARAWENIQAQKSLDELARRLEALGVVARTADTVPGGHSAALELSRLPKGDAAVIRIDTTASRNGPPRTTIQVQRGSQQLPATIISTNTNTELRKTLVDVAQKLLA